LNSFAKHAGLAIIISWSCMRPPYLKTFWCKISGNCLNHHDANFTTSKYQCETFQKVGCLKGHHKGKRDHGSARIQAHHTLPSYTLMCKMAWCNSLTSQGWEKPVFFSKKTNPPGFFSEETRFCYFFKENGKTLFLIVFIVSCNIIIFRITQ